MVVLYYQEINSGFIHRYMKTRWRNFGWLDYPSESVWLVPGTGEE